MSPDRNGPDRNGSQTESARWKSRLPLPALLIVADDQNLQLTSWQKFGMSRTFARKASFNIFMISYTYARISSSLPVLSVQIYIPFLIGV